jgi:NitT/TauT family transport system ATP-binding protein
MACSFEFKGVSKSFCNGAAPNLVLDQLELEIGRGEFICLLGSSGSGKSTLLRIIAGLETPDSGGVFLNGELLTGPNAKRVMVFQDFNQLFPWQTVRDNVIFPLRIQKRGSKRKLREIADQYLAMVKLEGYGEYYPHQLSGGMKQKAAIARALALQPEVLLMDEPFGSLDAQTRQTLQQMLLRVWEETGVTIVFVTHDIQEAVILADRIPILTKSKHSITAVITNPLPRPRLPGTPEFAGVWQRVCQFLDNVES